MVSYLAKLFIIYIATIFFFITYNYTSRKERSISVTEVLKKVKIFTFYIYALSISSGKLVGIKPYVHIFLYLAGGFILYFIYGLLIEKFNLLIEIMFNQWLKIISKIVYIFKLKKETFNNVITRILPPL